ncbi:unnamed protein product [Rhodiola kirilowii]
MVGSGGSDKAVCGQISQTTVASKAKLAPRFPDVKMSARQYGISEGKPIVSFSSAEVAAGAAFFKYSLVAKFSFGRPSISEIQGVLKKNWDFKGRCTLSEIWDDRHIMVILDSEADAITVLTSPIRKVGLATFRLFRYSPDFDRRTEPATTSKWVRLPGLPPPLFTRSYVEAIVNSFALFLDVDERSNACVNLKYARACVEIDASKPALEEVIISLPDGRKLTQKVKIEGNLLYCPRCKIHGHPLSDCRRGKPPKAAEIVGKDALQHETEMRRIKPGRQDQSDNLKVKRGVPAENRAKKVREAVQESNARIQGSVQESKMGASDHEPPENEGWVLVNRRSAARPVAHPSVARSSRASFQGQGSVVPTAHKDEVLAKAPAPAMVLNGSEAHKTNNRCGEEIQEQEVVRGIEGKTSKAVKDNNQKKRNKENRFGSLEGCSCVVPDVTEVASPLPNPVVVVPKPDEGALYKSQRKGVEAILRFASRVGVKTRVPDEVAIQILLSNLREKQGEGEIGRKRGYNQWRNTSVFLKRGERGVP